ncbi:LysR family transcriptional regulator [Pandoraea terrae]|uniref:LysR family transcriptional regulator n=1 Tax=Pandoraea terrae TaxID=1537710 RepID=A0A5E4XPW1_9BURK|nr:LysR family transcriptional regulator [Pandoraea terrae]VVE38419.1 LysR family transcriptional regulator [Pandoraea terrae]
MRFHKLDLNLLIALDAILADPHITRVAQRLHVSQSTMSGLLARLREYFRDQLIVQVGRKTVLTPFAEELADPLRSILDQTEKLLSTSIMFDPAASSHCFTVACSDYVWASLMFKVLQETARQAPLAKVWYAGSGHHFVNGNADFLVVPDRFASPDHPSEILCSERFSCVVWSGNELVGDSLSIDQFLNLGHVIAFSERPTLIEDWFAKQFGQKCNVARVSPSYTLIPQTVIGTNHIAALPTSMAQNYAEHLPLRILTPPVDLPILTDVLQWHWHKDQDPASRWFRALMVHTARSMVSQAAPPSFAGFRIDTRS